MDLETARQFEQAIRCDGRYPIEAYAFLHRALEFATQRLYGDGERQGPRHVTGRQLSEAIRELAVQSFGRLAPAVLSRWNVRSSRDFGEMVFLLVELGVMGRQDSDRVEDFDDVFEVSRAFCGYEIVPPSDAGE